VRDRKLLLINPIQHLRNQRQHGWSGIRFVPPLGLAYVAALTADHWQIRLVDENAGDDALRQVRRWRFVPDLVGISSYTATIPRAYQLAAHFRRQGIPVVVGGSHATALPQEVVRYADVAFVGQAEGTWPQLLEDFERGCLQEIYEGGMPPLDGLQLPRRDLYPRRYFFDAVLTAKGCPYRCEFCSVWKQYERQFFQRPVGEVLDELGRLRARHLFFVDDNFAANRRRAVGLCQGMVKQGIEKRFAIQASLELGLDEELLGWLQQAGCFLISVGLESTDEQTLQHIRKASNLRVGVSRFKESVARIHAHGMAVSASIIYGHDRDTPQTFREMEAFVAESGLDSIVHTILTPLPGTDLRQRLAAEGRLLDLPLPEGYAYFDAHHVAYVPAKVSSGELLAAKREAVRRWSSGPRMVGNLCRTWRRTGSLLAALAAFQNNRWAGINARS
jgi:radical SAM superfamily enzyme YgiQ (UPF0313 family)